MIDTVSLVVDSGIDTKGCIGERARLAQATRFDLRNFHAIVPGNGTVVFTPPEQISNDWIQSKS